jgi:hypothetical protein
MFARFLFLIIGFIFVIFLADSFGGNDMQTWIAVGGGIVYAMSRSNK